MQFIFELLTDIRRKWGLPLTCDPFIEGSLAEVLQRSTSI